MFAAIVAVGVAAAPRITNCLPPCPCREAVAMGKTRLAETPLDSNHIHDVFDDHPAMVALELSLPDGGQPGKAWLTVTDWDARPVKVRHVTEGWKQPSPGRWLQLVKAHLSAGTFHVVSHVQLPCGEVAMWLPTFVVHPKDPTSLFYWQLKVGIARQEGTLDDELRGWKRLEEIDGEDHALDRANALEAAGRTADAELERQGYGTRHPSGRTFSELSWPPFAFGVRGTRFNLVDGSRCRIGAILNELRRHLLVIPTTGPGNKGKRARLSKVISDLEPRQAKMNYGELIERDLEIGSGAVEMRSSTGSTPTCVQQPRPKVAASGFNKVLLRRYPNCWRPRDLGRSAPHCHR